MKQDKRTNIEVVTDLMEFSEYGALAQIFVIDALSKWSEIIKDKDPKEFENPLISGQAWVGVAQEINRKLNARYGSVVK